MIFEFYEQKYIKKVYLNWIWHSPPNRKAPFTVPVPNLAYDAHELNRY